MNHRLRSVLKWTGVVFSALIVVVVLTLALLDWSEMKGPIERFAAARSGRSVTIEGPLSLHVWSWTPRLVAQGLVIGNPPWDDGPPMARVERLEVELSLLPLLKGEVILPRLKIVRPELALRRNSTGRANWTFSSTRPTDATAPPAPKLPVVRSFLIDDGVLAIRDELLHLNVRGSLQAREKTAAREGEKALRIDGKGTLNDEPFTVRIAGGPLVNLDPEQPYPFDLDVTAGNIRMESTGTVQKPFDLGRFELAVRASGGDLADLYYLTQLAMPNTPPFKLSAQVERDESIIRVQRLEGTLGGSDVRGELTVDVSHERPAVTGTLRSNKLRLRDMAASFGAEPQPPGTLQGETERPKPSKKGVKESGPARKLFPDARLQVQRVQAMDADVRFSAKSIEARVPLEEVALRIQLRDGVLAVTPFELVLPQGKVHGTARVDTNGKTPHSKLDIHVRGVELEQFKGKGPDAQPPLSGIMQAHVELEGNGDSVHDLMAGADGQIAVVLPHGEIRAAFAELTGINVARGLGLLLKGDDERANIRCGIAHFEVNDGVMSANHVVLDTEDVRITGRGKIQLGPEELDLSVKGETKDPRIGRLRSPVQLTGPLRKPSISIDAGKTLKQGAIAAVLGVVATPLAAIVAFIDPGLAEDANCSKLLAEARPG